MSIEEQLRELGSELERAFDTQLNTLARDIPAPEKLFKFDEPRKFEFDRAWPIHKVAVELEGMYETKQGRFIRCHNCHETVRATKGDGSPGAPIPHVGYHQREGRFLSDMMKYNRASELGWYVLRFANHHVHTDPFGMIELIRKSLARRQYRAQSIDALSGQEHRVMCLVAAGFNSQQIADRLNIRPNSVRTFVVTAREKLCARNRAEAVAKAIYWGVLKFEDIDFYQALQLPPETL